MSEEKKQNDNTGNFPAEVQPKTPDNETGNQNAGTEINRKTERSDRPEQA